MDDDDDERVGRAWKQKTRHLQTHSMYLKIKQVLMKLGTDVTRSSSRVGHRPTNCLAGFNGPPCSQEGRTRCRGEEVPLTSSPLHLVGEGERGEWNKGEVKEKRRHNGEAAGVLLFSFRAYSAGALLCPQYVAIRLE